MEENSIEYSDKIIGCIGRIRKRIDGENINNENQYSIKIVKAIDSNFYWVLKWRQYYDYNLETYLCTTKVLSVINIEQVDLDLHLFTTVLKSKQQINDEFYDNIWKEIEEMNL